MLHGSPKNFGVPNRKEPIRVTLNCSKDTPARVTRMREESAGFTDFLARGFVMQNPLIRGARAASLFALEGMPKCRTRLIRFGMGADLPQADLALKMKEEQTHA